MSDPAQDRRGFDFGPDDFGRDAANDRGSAGGDGRHDDGSEKKSRWGCFFYGCLGILVTGGLLTAVLVVGGLYVMRGQVTAYTEEAPAALPVVEASDEEIADVQRRIEAVTEMLDDTGPADDEAPDATPDGELEQGDAGADTEPTEAADAEPVDAPPAGVREIALTARQINALLSRQAELRGRVYVSIGDGKLTGDISVPTDFLPIGKGRFFNAKAVLSVGMQGGRFFVNVVDAEVKGQRLPEAVLSAIAKQNLADPFYDDPKVAEVLGRFQSVELVGDRLVLRIKPRDAAEAKQPEADETPSTRPAAAAEPDA